MNAAAKLPKQETLIYDAYWWKQPGITVIARVQAKQSGSDGKGQPAEVVSIAERADQRLNRKFRRMVDRYNKKPVIAAVAVARELAGFIWAIGQIQD